MDPEDYQKDTPEDYHRLCRKIAKKIVERDLTVPAIMLLESIKPVSFLGSQMLVFANPVISLIVQTGEYYRFVRMIEDRENIERLTLAIEEENAEASRIRSEMKRERRKKRRTFFRRMLGRKDNNLHETEGRSSGSGQS
ncbi:hypothetical protein CSA37_00665 [Candidatus Fermentibacteria bacterium]|nr:MAG: hypothetical protein CSA37_00665 [Candidatus Fermentibacteria bacterium]